MEIRVRQGLYMYDKSYSQYDVTIYSRKLCSVPHPPTPYKILPVRLCIVNILLHSYVYTTTPVNKKGYELLS